MPNHLEIYLPEYKVTLFIDETDLHIFQKHKWLYSKVYNRLFFNTHFCYRTKAVYLHRLILEAPKNLSVDHINGNGMDNRRSNLRLCTTQQNSFNTKKRANCSSKYKGVYKHQSGKWIANIRINGDKKAIGQFDNEEDAARAYDNEARKIQGSFAVLNFN